MNLYHVHAVYHRERNAKAHRVRNMLVLANSHGDAKDKVMAQELPEKVAEVLVRATDPDQKFPDDLDIGCGERDLFRARRLRPNQADVPDAGSRRIRQLARPRVGHVGDRHT